MQQQDATTRKMIEQMQALVARSARRWRRLILLEALGLAIAAPLAFLWLVFLIDNLLFLPAWARWTALAVFLAGVAWLIRSLVLRWRRSRFSDDEVALAMERRTAGGVQNRLINALQLARDAADDVRRAVVEENLQHLRQVHMEQAAQARPALIRIAAAVAVVLVGVFFAVTRTTHFTNAAQRILLPFVAIDPLYQTLLTVEPGNITGSGDIPIIVTIKGRPPTELTLLRNVGGDRTAETIPVPAGADTVTHTFRGVRESMAYAVRGGDYTSAWYRIEVPAPSLLSLVRVTFDYPDYTKLPDKQIETAGGDLEALRGTRAAVTFFFDQPTDEAVLVIQKPTAAGGGPDGVAADAPAGPPSSRAGDAVQRLSLRQLAPSQFAGDIRFEDVLGYHIETRKAGQPSFTSPSYGLKMLIDQPPTLVLTGLEQSAEVDADAALPLQIAATDDYGIDRVAVSCRRVGGPVGGMQTVEGGAENADDGAAAPPGDDGPPWSDLQTWQGKSQLAVRGGLVMPIASLGAAEGDTFEVALRAADTDPLKKGRWAVGVAYTLIVGGEGVALQVAYEQLLRTEDELRKIAGQQAALMAQTAEWVNKLDADSGLRWDDATNLQTLDSALKALSAGEEGIRQYALRVTRGMSPAAGSLQLSMAMLADAEMVRATRIIEAVMGRENPQARRSTLAESRVTQERIIRSLNEVLEQHEKFRHDWELANMVPFVKMMADRQAKLRDESSKLADPPAAASDASAAPATPLPPADVIAKSAARRQGKIAELVGLAQPAVARAGQRLQATDAAIAQTFATAAIGLGDAALGSALTASSSAVAAGNWKDAAARQAQAAGMLGDIYAALKKAQFEAAQRALAALSERAKSDVDAQQEIEKLRQGSAENALSLPDDLTIEDIVRMAEVEGKKRGGGGEDRGGDNGRRFDEISQAALQQADSGARQGLEGVRLAGQPGGWGNAQGLSDKPTNVVKPYIQEKFEDLVGKLLDEADAYQQKYDTLNINTAQSLNESGEIGKEGGKMNSTAAAAFTGNQKPPPTDSGGVSRTGRQGGRSHGMVVGDKSINRRGRDTVQEGQENIPDQEGSMKEEMSDDPQMDQSLGQGGKKVDGKDLNWNTKDAGTFDESKIDKMNAPEATERRVERMGKPIDAATADGLRELNTSQEQMIERIKAIKKELNNLFLPTEHLDELMAELTENFEAIKERPSPDLFRLQSQTLDKLRNSARMFQAAGSGLQPSLPRTQTVRGKVLDEPARPTNPGYEDAVKTYFELLSVQ